MLEFVKDWTVNIVMLVLFIVIIEMLLPKGKMKKYVNLLTGTILIIVIIDPITGLFGKDFDFSASQTAAASNIDKKEITNASKLLEEEQVKQTIELYRSRIIEQIVQSAKEVDGVKDAEADIIINEDYDSEYFGEIKRIYINAVIKGNDSAGRKAGSSGDNESSDPGSGTSDEDNGEKGVKDSVTVNKVESIKVGGLTRVGSGNTVFDASLNERLSKRIGEVFGVDKENIIIEQIQR